MKITWLYLPLCLAFVCSFSAMAQENELSPTPLYTTSTLPKTANLPQAESFLIMETVDRAENPSYGYNWTANWLNNQLKAKEQHRHCTPLAKTDPNFGVYEKCDATLEFVDSKKAKFISYQSKWMGCQGTETYTFHQHTPHQVFSWLAQQETWFCEIRTPAAKTTKRQQQNLLANEEHPTYLFDFQLNKKQEIVYLTATYGSEGFSVTWEIKKGEKGGTTLTIKNECAQNASEE